MTRLEIMNDKLNKGWKPDWSTPPIQSSVMITIYYVFFGVGRCFNYSLVVISLLKRK